MLGWFQALMPREERFFDLFARHARTLLAGAEALQGLLEGGERVPEFCQRIARHEQEADEITREVLLAVRRTFITPFDRSSIKDLITAMDDAIDQMNQTAKTITLFEVREFEPGMQEMGALIVSAAKLAVDGIPLLRSIDKEAGRLNAMAEAITKLEGQSDDLHDQGLKGLFRAHGQSNAMAYIVGSEIYGHLEEVLDRFEDVGNEIGSLVIEHV